MVFDLVEGSSMGLQMPLQVTQVISTPTWCAEIDYRGDTHFRKSNVVTDECLETITDIVFGGSLQRNESNLQCQSANLKLVANENYVFHEIWNLLIPHDDDAEIDESFPCLFNQSYLADFWALAVCESMTDGLSTCYWFDTVSQSITSAFRCRKYGDHVSATDFDRNGYRPIIRDQAAYNWLLDMLASYVLAMGSGNSKWLSRQKIDLEVSDSMYVGIFDSMYVDIIFLKPTIIEDLYLYKLSFENKGDVSKSEIQSYDVRNDVKHEKFNEGIRHAECFFPVDAGANLFMVKLGGTVKVNCVWDPGISSKTMHQNGLMKTTEAHLLLEFTSLRFNYFYDAHVKENTQVVHKITMSLEKPLDAWSDKYLTVEVTMQHQNVVQPIQLVQGYSDNLLLSEAIGEEHAISNDSTSKDNRGCFGDFYSEDEANAQV
ncbi:hypothetical protein H5410_061846 [Solanum commersonii]|uniref:Uncharacterized protein n=1 Tax=Solanum commersonii TaxID=4109 RepID=A0A9J5WAF5_SOLCO|nr:hypothetical protein H5410_061846 [Solanum commersonii]